MDDTEPIGFNKRRADGRDKCDLTKKNLQLKARKLNPINTTSFVQILGTGMDTQDTSSSVLLFFDNQRFILNAGEGLQRFCTEHKIKLSKIDHIFLSRVCSETAGGLPGLLLTLAGVGDEGMSLNIWGPSDLKYLVDAMKSFIPNAAMVHSRSFGPIFDTDDSDMLDQSRHSDPIVLVNDEVVKISAVVLQPNYFQSQLLTSSEGHLDEMMDHSLEPLGHHNRKKHPTAKPGDMSVVYVCELSEIKGKFDPEKAKALGLKPGPKYRELQLGKSVKSDHQNIVVSVTQIRVEGKEIRESEIIDMCMLQVHPSDVLGPSIPGPIVLLVDCPTESHLEALLSVQLLTRYYTDPMGHQPADGKRVTCIIHLSPSLIVSCSSYQIWMKKFGSVQHIMAGLEKKNVDIPILKSSSRISTRLNYLCPQFFPASGFCTIPNSNFSIPGSLTSSEGSISEPCEIVSAENLLKYTLRPYAHLGLDRSCVPTKVATSEIIDQLISETPEVIEAAQRVSQLWQKTSQSNRDIIPVPDHKKMVDGQWLYEDSSPNCLENIKRDDLEIVLLGTGSSQPSKYRNVSAVYINLFSKGGLLLDCGEGTLGQLKRRYGVNGADDAVRALKCIWISHIHADHHAGLARILSQRRDLLKDVPHEPLLVVGPRQLQRYLDAYQKLEDLNMEFLDCNYTTSASLDAFENVESDKDLDSPENQANSQGMNHEKDAVSLVLKKLKEVIREAGLEALISFPVVHCPQAFGVVLKAAERINSVGKVIPGWKVVYSGDTRPCPELVEASHCATVLIHEATFEDAMVEEAIAKNHSTTKEAMEMGDSANAYRIILTHFSQRYPKIPVLDETHMHNTCVAFDLMSINVADLPVLPKVLPYLKLLFRNEVILDDPDDVLMDTVSTMAS